MGCCVFRISLRYFTDRKQYKHGIIRKENLLIKRFVLCVTFDSDLVFYSSAAHHHTSTIPIALHFFSEYRKNPKDKESVLFSILVLLAPSLRIKASYKSFLAVLMAFQSILASSLPLYYLPFPSDTQF